ncbi:MAG: cytochrome c biogenesis protein CcdA [Ferruginibacter sp.]
MKKTGILISFLFFLLSTTVFAQDSAYVQWQASAKKIVDGEYELHFNGIIKSGWHVYVQSSAADGLDGLKISFPDPAIQLEDIPKITGQTKTIADLIFQNKQLQVAEQEVELVAKIKITDAIPSMLKTTITYYVANKETFIPEDKIENIKLKEGVDLSSSNNILIPSIHLNNPVNNCGGTQTSAGKGLLTLFLLGFAGGLLAIFTPCVFPMIPLTVSFFTKKGTSKKRGIANAMLYGLFIFLIYILLSLPFHFLDKLNPEILNNISTNVYLNIFFFIVFLIFAFSFFGYYEIVLPGNLSNKTGSKADGKILGIFFMALTLAIVSFSCTGPILGSLLAGSLSADGGAIQLTAGMAGFGLALALPFALFAMSPNLLHALPKSGGWLHTFKVVLGFIELGLAFKFLSNADLVMHWGILKREIFIGIWIVIGVLLTLYLLKKIKFPHDSFSKQISKQRIIVALIFTIFTLYLIPGLTNTKWANLSLISGFPPPLYYSIYHAKSDCIFDLNCAQDFDEGMKIAKAENKPVLLDFTGYACVNCRRMEENVWSRPDVLKIMREKFVVISLYVDDKKKLPVNEQFTYKTKDGAEKEIVTIGDKWATFETENFQNNAQPLYALLDTNKILLNHPVGYTPDADQYRQWLECGLDAFNKTK